MINATEIKRILISLDDIMDMRLGLIKTLNEEVFEKILSKDVMQYITRVNDDYCAEALGWPKEMWYEAYRNRNIDVMKNSVVNHVPNIVTNIILEYLGSNEEAIGSIVFELEVNTFPYQLNEEEKEVLRDVLTEMFPIIEQISLVEVDLNNLAPTMIKGKYFIVGIYDFYNWTTTHAEELKKIIMPLVTIIAPRFVKDEFGYLNKKLNDLDSNEKTILQMDPFKLIETTLAHKFRLMFAPACDYAPVFIPPIKNPNKDATDLDDQSGPSLFGTHESSLSDLLSQFLQRSAVSQGEQTGQE